MYVVAAPRRRLAPGGPPVLRAGHGQLCAIDLFIAQSCPQFFLGGRQFVAQLFGPRLHFWRGSPMRARQVIHGLHFNPLQLPPFVKGCEQGRSRSSPPAPDAPPMLRIGQGVSKTGRVRARPARTPWRARGWGFLRADHQQPQRNDRPDRSRPP